MTIQFALIAGAACGVILSACASLPGTPLKHPCASGEEVVVSNQSLEWVRVYTVPIGRYPLSAPGGSGVVELGHLRPGTETTYSVVGGVSVQVLPLDQPRGIDGNWRVPKDVFFSCLAPID